MTVDRARRDEDEVADFCPDRRLQQYTGGCHIVGHIHLWLRHRFWHEREGSHVDNRLDSLPLEQRLDQLAIAHVALDETGAPGHCLPVAPTEVVEYDHSMPPREALIYDDAADVSCTAGDEDPRRHAGGSIPNSRRTASSRP